MNKSFEKISKASEDCIKRIDALAAAQMKEAATDYVYSDAMQAERKERRRAAAQQAITDNAAAAKQIALDEIESMRTKFKAYMMTSKDPAALSNLQALINTHTELTPAEVQAFASTGDYTILRLLTPLSRGTVTAPRIEDFERDMSEVINHFDLLASFAGSNNELREAVTARPFGLTPTVATAILKGQRFAEKMTELAKRWEGVTGNA